MLALPVLHCHSHSRSAQRHDAHLHESEGRQRAEGGEERRREHADLLPHRIHVDSREASQHASLSFGCKQSEHHDVAERAIAWPCQVVTKGDVAVQVTSCTWIGMLMACRKYHMAPAVKMMPCNANSWISARRQRYMSGPGRLYPKFDQEGGTAQRQCTLGDGPLVFRARSTYTIGCSWVRQRDGSLQAGMMPFRFNQLAVARDGATGTLTPNPDLTLTLTMTLNPQTETLTGPPPTGYTVPPMTRPRGYQVLSSNQFHRL